MRAINEAPTPGQVEFSKPQEETRTEIEGLFGVMQDRFLIMPKTLECWYQQEILTTAEVCEVIHNLLVRRPSQEPSNLRYTAKTVGDIISQFLDEEKSRCIQRQVEVSADNDVLGDVGVDWRICPADMNIRLETLDIVKNLKT